MKTKRDASRAGRAQEEFLTPITENKTKRWISRGTIPIARGGPKLRPRFRLIILTAVARPNSRVARTEESDARSSPPVQRLPVQRQPRVI